MLLLLAGPPVLWPSSRLCSTLPPAFLCLLLFFTCSSRLFLRPGVPLTYWCLFFAWSFELWKYELGLRLSCGTSAVLVVQVTILCNRNFNNNNKTFYELFVKQWVWKVTLQCRSRGSDFNMINLFPYLKVHCSNWNWVCVAGRRDNRSVLVLMLLVWGWLLKGIASAHKLRREIGSGHVLHFSSKRDKGERREMDVAHTHWFCWVFWFAFFFFFLTFCFRIRLWWKKLCIWEFLCAFSYHVITWQLLHRNMFIVKDLSVSLKIIQKNMSWFNPGLLKPVPVPCPCQVSLFSQSDSLGEMEISIPIDTGNTK